MIASGDSTIMDWVILASAVLPVLIVLIGSYFFLRAGRRAEERDGR